MNGLIGSQFVDFGTYQKKKVVDFAFFIFGHNSTVHPTNFLC